MKIFPTHILSLEKNYALTNFRRWGTSSEPWKLTYPNFQLPREGVGLVGEVMGQDLVEVSEEYLGRIMGEYRQEVLLVHPTLTRQNRTFLFSHL